MTARVVPCPKCGTLTPFSPANPYRPFCSERCRVDDLAAWAQERYRIPGEDGPPAIGGESGE
ncbi:DNA gyrase inhibitor YacG [Chitiniphilus purpureus]|uniref:DNA gyrase inhibitor YacG n=1 Tax=Chitiniphilus purpureus TaxID=2981137 RepID=A0ABY6DQE0_9NEIS|nr:DNA gyrase inhibitor YacG [Chitiniphilus sp. CD1]UXY16587.1 DNA gyrase inhibitor YacG [Chitiniphilus sp. CD1]